MTAQPPPLIRKSASLADLHRIAATAIRVLHDMDRGARYGEDRKRMEGRCLDLISAAQALSPAIEAVTLGDVLIQLAFTVRHIEQLDSFVPEGGEGEERLAMVRLSVIGACSALYGFVDKGEIDSEALLYLSGVGPG